MKPWKYCQQVGSGAWHSTDAANKSTVFRIVYSILRNKVSSIDIDKFIAIYAEAVHNSS